MLGHVLYGDLCVDDPSLKHCRARRSRLVRRLQQRSLEKIVRFVNRPVRVAVEPSQGVKGIAADVVRVLGIERKALECWAANEAGGWGEVAHMQTHARRSDVRGQAVGLHEGAVTRLRAVNVLDVYDDAVVE